MFPIYTIGQISVCWSNLVCYLGVDVNTKLNWSDHYRTIAAKATRTLNCLQCSMFGCSFEAKIKVYKAIITPVLEYACVIWSPHTSKEIYTLEAMQPYTAHWACNSWRIPNTSLWSISSNDCLSMLHWTSLQTWQKYLVCVSYMMFLLNVVQ